MMQLLTNIRAAAFSKRKMIDSFKHFLEHDAGASVRTEPHQKDRKYLHVQITEQFKKQEEGRKQLRLQQMKERKKLLEQKVSTESKLLTSSEKDQLTDLNKQIKSLSEILQKQASELQRIDKSLQQTEGSHVVIEGMKKLVVLNKIQYLKHMNMHPTGLVLHPETIKVIENVHYLVNNNLPVNKYKVFELMPQLFKQQIGELEESMQRLIEQKQLDPETDPSGRIRFFVRHKSRFVHPEQQILDLQDQRRAIFENMEEQVVKIMEPHMNYVRLVQQGQTPFRNTMHMISVLIAQNLPLKLTQAEQALRNSLIQISELKNKFTTYNEETNDKIIKMRYRYIEPPEYVKNHPILLQRYEKLMIKYTNPTEVTLGLEENPDDGGRAYLQAKLQQITANKYHPKIEELWNSGRRDELIANKKKLEIDFYNDSTMIFEEYQQMIANQKEKQEFLKIPKKARQIEEQKFNHLSLDDLTKTIFINNKNPVKHNLNFFTSFLGIPNQQQAKKLFNSFSYLRVLPDQQEITIEHLKYQIIKFKSP